MPDQFDSAAVTAELPRLDTGRVRTTSGRARPVVLSDLELVLHAEADDPTAGRGWPRPWAGGNPAGIAGESGGRSGDAREDRPASLALLVAHLATLVILAIPAMLVVAFGIALAAR